jgi:ribose transport system ATP-binding protein
VRAPEASPQDSSFGRLGGRRAAVTAHRGEIIGLAGLAGHGQTDMLIRLFDAAGAEPAITVVDGPVALVAGRPAERRHLSLWSIARNISVGSLATCCAAC